MATRTPLADYNAQSLAWRNVWENKEAETLAKEGATATDPPLNARTSIKNSPRSSLSKVLTRFCTNRLKPIVTLASVENFIRNAQGNVDFTAVSKNRVKG